MNMSKGIKKVTFLVAVLACIASCATQSNVFHDEKMDFGAIQAVAFMPFANLTRDSMAGERVRDIFVTKLLATGAIYVVPVGEVARGLAKTEVVSPATPSPEEAVKLGGILKVQAVITGSVREYGEVRSGTTSANIVSIGAQLIETQTGRVVWSASSTQGGIGIADRLFGGGGKAMDIVTDRAIDDLINKLFR
jgi:polysaccharide biosynthesis protein PelC